MDVLHKSDINTILTKHLGDEAYEFITCDVKNICDVSIGFLSSVSKVSITFKTHGITKNLHLFVKKLPQDESHREDVLAMELCDKEPIVYREFLSQVKDGTFFPKCYLAKSNDTLVLEDLAFHGYKNLPNMVDYDLEHCEKAIESIAKLHAESFAFEKNKNCKMDEHIPDIGKENIFTTDVNHVGRKRYDSGIAASKRFVEVYMPHVAEQTKETSFEFMEVLPYRLSKSERIPNVLTHGDIWNNNLMFKYDADGTISNVRIIDFQTCTYKPPSFDLQLFLHCCTDRAFREEFYPHLMDFYYEQLKSELIYRNVQIDDIMSREQFDRACEETLPTVLVFASSYMQVIGLPEKTLKYILSSEGLWRKFYQEDRTDIVLQGAEESEVYRTKLEEGFTDIFNYFESHCN